MKTNLNKKKFLLSFMPINDVESVEQEDIFASV